MTEYWTRTDLQKLPEVKRPGDLLFYADSDANRIGVHVSDGGIPVTLTGSIRAWIILPDGTTIQEDGEKDGNRAWVDLPDEAYVAQGPIGIYLKHINGTKIATLGGVEGYVYRRT